MASGELKFLPGDSEGEVDASSFNNVVPVKYAEYAEVRPPAVCTVGKVKSTIGREWVLSVATYDRLTRSHKSFTIAILVPPTGRFANLRNLAPGTMVSVRGVLSGITTTEVTTIDLEAVTFISISNANRSTPAVSASSPTTAVGTVGRTKRQRRQAQDLTPSKKIRIGPPEMFLKGAELAEFLGDSAAEEKGGSDQPSLPGPSNA